MLTAKLRFVGGAEGHEEIKLTLPATIGRSPNNEIKLSQPLVSRRHCEIYAINDQLWVRDLGSTNGTYVGNVQIDGDCPLLPGELLTVGTVTFRALYGELLETDASGFLRTPNSAADQETVNLSDAGTVVEPNTTGDVIPQKEEVRADAEL